MNGTNNTITIKRFVTTATKKQTTETIASGVEVYLEQEKPELSQLYNNESAFKTFRCFSEFMDVKIGDWIVDKDSNEYKVAGVQKFENDEIDDHCEIIMNIEHTNS